MNLEPYQIQAAEWLAKRKLGAVIAPAGSGKTLCAAAALNMVLLARHRTEKVEVGWIANTREQTDQARKALDLFPAIGNMANVEIACAQARNDWSQKSVLIVDECAHITAPIWLDQVQTCPGAVWGFTATPKTNDPDRDQLFEQMFEGNFFTVDRSNVANRLVPARVIMLSDTDDARAEIDEEIQKLMKIRARQFRFMTEQELYIMCSWQACAEIGIFKNQMRNQAIIAKAFFHFEKGQRVLVLVNKVEHALELVRHIPHAIACYSKMGAKRRRDALENFRSGALSCLIATSLADEGLDLPMAEVLIMGSGGRSAAKAEQRTGRVLRAFAGKTEGIIYDFYDRQHPTMERQSKARQALYRKLGYQFESTF